MDQNTDRGRFDPTKHKPIPSVIDAIAAETPERPFLSIPNENDTYSSWRDISYGSFARAVDRCAWWLMEKLGESQSFETLSYIGPQDVTCLIFLLASVKTGHNTLCCSPVSNLEDHLVLLEASKCKLLLHPETTPPIVLSILQQRNMDDTALPQLDEWLAESPVVHFPYSKTLLQAWKDPFALVHSSGTTGKPKLHQLTHASVATAPRLQNTHIDNPTVFHLWRGLRVLLAGPISTAAGIFYGLPITIEFGWTTVLLPPIPPTAELVGTIHKTANAHVVLSQPIIYPELIKNAEFLNDLSRLHYLAYTGAPCLSHVGDRIASKTRLVSLLGATEMGPIPTELADAEDWEYTKFAPVLPHRLEHVHADLYELVIVRDGEGDDNEGKYRMNPEPVFCTLPHLSEYRTRDLYSKHPAKAGLWRFRGRKDDLVALSSTSPTQEPRLMFPVPIESAVMTHPKIKAAIVLGNGKPRPLLLIEPSEKFTELEHRSQTLELVQEVILPILEEVNQQYPPYARIDRDLIAVIPPGESMPTNTKGYISRRLTTEKYEAMVSPLFALQDKDSDFPTSRK